MNKFEILNCVLALLPPLAGLKNYRYLRRDLRLLLLLLSMAFLVDFTGLTFGLFGWNVYWAFHLYAPIEFSILVYIFYLWLKDLTWSRFILFLIPAYVVFSILNTLFLTEIDKINYMPISLSYFIYTAASSLLLYRYRTSNKDLRHMLRDSYFWIYSAILVFSSGSLCYFAFYELVSKHILYLVWYFHIIMNISGNVLFTIGFLCQGRQLESSGDSLSRHLYY